MLEWPRLSPEGRKTLHAAIFLSFCLGFVAWLLTGEPAAGAAITLIGIFVGTLLYGFGLVPPSAMHPPVFFYVMGAVMVAMMLFQMRYGGRRGPGAWQDLEAQFGTEAPPPSGVRRWPRLTVRRFPSQFTYQEFRYRRVFTSFDKDGVYLATSWPQSLVYGAVRVPRHNVATCETDRAANRGPTTLSLRYPPMELTLADGDGQVGAWCAAYEIAPPTQSR